MLFTDKEIDIIRHLGRYVTEAGSEKSYIIRDRIYPNVEKVLSTREGDRKFRQIVERYVDRNSSKLNEPCPISLIPFYDSDKAAFFDLFGTSDSEIKQVVKEMLKLVSDKAKFRLVSQNPVFVLLYCAIRYYGLQVEKTKTKDAAAGLNAALLIYALANYPSIFSKYFKYGANEGVMRFTADQLTEKYFFKIYGHVLGTLNASITSSYSYLKSFFVTMEDVEVVRFIQRVRNDQNSLIKKIAMRYHENYKKGLGITTQTETYDTGDLIDDQQNDTSIIDTLSDKVSLNIITSGIDLRRLSTAGKWSEVSMAELRIYIIQILSEKYLRELKSFITAVLFVYLYTEKHQVSTIKSKEFLSFGLQLFRKTKSNDPNISTIKTLLNKWGDDTGIHSKFRRDHTQSSYKKGIFWYIMLSIQQLI